MSAQPRLPLTIVVAVSPSNGIGAGGTLPWRLRREMAYFKHLTSAAPSGSKNAVIMGRNTWESIPDRFRPLTGRVNVVVSRTASAEDLGIDKAEDTHLFKSPSAALSYLRSRHQSQESEALSRVFLIGGAQLYSQALQAAHDESQSDDWNLDRLLITRIFKPEYAQCDVFLPEYRTSQQVEEEQGAEAAKHEEQTAGTAEQEESASSSQTPLTRHVWQRSTVAELEEYASGKVPGIDSLGGTQEEKGTSYEFQMWTRIKK
ncbi:hypothetical protein V8E36_001448 [Tilletia maclaganii]